MLVINGSLHPRFDRNGTSLKACSGVGIQDPHTVVFAIWGARFHLLRSHGSSETD